MQQNPFPRFPNGQPTHDEQSGANPRFCVPALADHLEGARLTHPSLETIRSPSTHLRIDPPPYGSSPNWSIDSISLKRIISYLIDIMAEYECDSH
jgi:hypothetical protein